MGVIKIGIKIHRIYNQFFSDEGNANLCSWLKCKFSIIRPYFKYAMAVTIRTEKLRTRVPQINYKHLSSYQLHTFPCVVYIYANFIGRQLSFIYLISASHYSQSFFSYTMTASTIVRGVPQGKMKNMTIWRLLTALHKYKDKWSSVNVILPALLNASCHKNTKNGAI